MTEADLLQKIAGLLVFLTLNVTVLTINVTILSIAITRALKTVRKGRS